MTLVNRGRASTTRLGGRRKINHHRLLGARRRDTVRPKTKGIWAVPTNGRGHRTLGSPIFVSEGAGPLELRRGPVCRLARARRHEIGPSERGGRAATLNERCCETSRRGAIAALAPAMVRPPDEACYFPAERRFGCSPSFSLECFSRGSSRTSASGCPFASRTSSIGESPSTWCSA